MKKLFIGLALVLPVTTLADWTAPLSPPPMCNPGKPGCDALLNVTGDLQVKDGGLVVGNTAPIFGIYTPKKVIASDFCYYHAGSTDSQDCVRGGGGTTPINNLTGCTISGNTITCNGSTLAMNNSTDITNLNTAISNFFATNPTFLSDYFTTNDIHLGGVSSLFAGHGITLSPNPITTMGTISVNSQQIVSTIGNCAVDPSGNPTGMVLGGVNVDGTANCVPQQQCTGTNCPPVTPGIGGSGTPGYLALFTEDPKKIGNSIAYEAKGGIYVNQQNSSAGPPEASMSIGANTGGAALKTSGKLAFTGIGEGAGTRILSGDATGNATWRLPSDIGLGTSFWDKILNADGTNSGNIKNTNPGAVSVSSNSNYAFVAQGPVSGVMGISNGPGAGAGVIGVATVPGGLAGQFNAYSNNGITDLNGYALMASGRVRIEDGTESGATNQSPKILATTDGQGTASWKTKDELNIGLPDCADGQTVKKVSGHWVCVDFPTTPPPPAPAPAPLSVSTNAIYCPGGSGVHYNHGGNPMHYAARVDITVTGGVPPYKVTYAPVCYGAYGDSVDVRRSNGHIDVRDSMNAVVSAQVTDDIHYFPPFKDTDVVNGVERAVTDRPLTY